MTHVAAACSGNAAASKSTVAATATSPAVCLLVVMVQQVVMCLLTIDSTNALMCSPCLPFLYTLLQGTANPNCGLCLVEGCLNVCL